ncbi:MAG TPA: hypothetical protein VNT79_07150, partial [Phycisphaerae bacterium]|nr:hypothetical protein [Phycisphaerae bacterium]
MMVRGSIPVWAFVVSGLAIASVPARGEEPQPKGGRPPASQPAAVRTYGKVRVLCVGIREFPHPLATLECAEN